MTGLWVAALLGVAAVLLLPRPRTPLAQRRRAQRRSAQRQPRRRRPGGFRRGRADPGAQDLPLVIHQLTGLLAAGRAPHQLWADAAALQAAGMQATEMQPGGQLQPGAGQPAESGAAAGTLSAQLLPVLEAAARAASLGLSPVPVFLAAAGEPGGADGRPVRSPAGRRYRARRSSAEDLDRMWVELAACVSVSERSGAPLAGVLDRYAAQLESGLDSQAARDTALAGPQATVRLLTWLPVGGLGLGYLLGADPVGILLGSPIGWLAAAAGIALAVIGRLWSTALVRRAAGP